MTAAGFAKHAGVFLIDRATARRVSHFVAISETVKRSNCRWLGVAPEKVTTIPRGRDPSRFCNIADEEITRVRNEIFMGSSGPLLLSVGRLIESKGHVDVVRALPALVKTYPGIKYVIAGEGPRRGLLKREARELGLRNQVVLPGTRDDVPLLLAAADLFVFPSHYEGHGGALVEAMFAGLPIAAADTPVHRESLTDGETARLFPVAQPDAIASNLSDLLVNRNEAAELGRRAHTVALTRFHIDRVAQKHEELYTRLSQGELFIT